MKKNIKIREELVERFDSQEMVMLTGGNKYLKKAWEIIKGIFGGGDIHGNCAETNGENCECSY